MKLSDAKRVVASYLVGEAVPKEDLEDACTTLNRGDREYTQFLEENLGLPAPSGSLCDVFSERVAEFCEMTEAERRQEMPELSAHLTACRACQATYREVYLGAFAASASWMKSHWRRLKEPIRLKLGWVGELLPTGLGPPPEPALAHARVGTHLGSAEPDAKEWKICLDEPADLFLRLTITGRQSGSTVGVTLALEGEGASAPAARDIKLEAYKVDGAREVLFEADQLQVHRTTPLELEVGTWSIRLVTVDGRAWVIPLVLDHVG